MRSWLFQIFQLHGLSWGLWHHRGGGHRATHRNWPHHPSRGLPFPPTQPCHDPPFQTSPVQPVRPAYSPAQKLPASWADLPCQWLGIHHPKPAWVDLKVDVTPHRMAGHFRTLSRWKEVDLESMFGFNSLLDGLLTMRKGRWSISTYDEKVRRCLVVTDISRNSWDFW